MTSLCDVAATAVCGRYLAGGLIPGPLLANALNWLDGELGLMVTATSRS